MLKKNNLFSLNKKIFEIIDYGNFIITVDFLKENIKELYELFAPVRYVKVYPERKGIRFIVIAANPKIFFAEWNTFSENTISNLYRAMLEEKEVYLYRLKSINI